MSVETFDMSELEDSFTDRAVVNESNKKETVYKGSYNVTFKKVSLQVAPEDSQTPGRRIINAQVSIAKGDKAITKFVKLSPDVKRKMTVAGEMTLVGPKDEGYDLSLPMDTPSKLWGHVEAVLNPKGDLSQADVVRSLPDTTLDAFILEGFAMDGGGMKFPDSDPKKDLAAYETERVSFINAGYVPQNFFSSFKAVK